jgi:disulfide bond formation protein DsbB
LVATRQRPVFIIGFLACASLIAAALYLQHVLGLEPCPLCILQRVAVIALGVVFAIAAIHNPGPIGRRLYALLSFVIAAAGAGVAGRHVWLQHLPADQVPACGPGLSYMLDNFPFMHALDLILRGSGECAEVTWRLLGLSIPEWTLGAFVVFMIAAIAVFIRRA